MVLILVNFESCPDDFHRLRLPKRGEILRSFATPEQETSL